MEMESSRRPFSRSNEPGLKKPRLAENPNGRAFGQRPGGGANPVLSRFRVSDRDVGSDDPNRGDGGYVPQPLQHQELVSQYKTALAELTFNSKPIITNLTIIAGENVHAAKSVAATVCGNIIEVPSEQKLPSLYLLDSIVKNIGRDYIKYFAARLPEVFCKAYRQVEPPIHQSMRHLFGTWKGVFPAQTLQMIEKELGFSSTANGSSSGAATSRPDSQSQRPAHSIHVNPKYLERQRLQQPARAKGMASDFSGVMANSIDDDAERPARAASISAGRPWVDPAVKMHHSNTDALSDRVHEENIGAEYGEYEYGSDLHRNSNPGIGRIGGKITETLPTQRNGFNIKHGLTNYSAPKSTNADPRLKTAPGIATRNSGGLSSSWKNSEEEEFMWDDMNSRLTDHGPPDISSNSRKDHWASDDSEKLGLGGQFRKPKGGNDYASTADMDTSANPTEQKDLSALGQRMSSPWTLQDSIGIDRLTPSGTPVISSVHSERYASSLSGLSTSGDSSVTRMGSRAQVASSRIGTSSLGFNAAAGPTGALGKQQLQSVRAASPSGQSSMHQYSPSPTSAVHPRHHSQSLADQDFAEDPLPIPTPNVRLGSKAKSQPQDLSSSIPDIQSRHKYPFQQQPDSIESESFGHTKKPHVPQVSTFSTPSTVGDSIPDLSNVLAAESSGQLNTSSLLAAVMKTGILSDKSITCSLPNLNRRDMGHIPSQSGVQPPLQSGPSPTLALPGPKVASAPSSGHLSGENSPASSNVSQKKVAHLPIPPSQPPSSLDGSASASSTVVSNASDPISNLLSSLVAKGLISASKSESPTPVPSQKLAELHNKGLGAPASKSVSVSPVSVSVSVSPSRPVTSQTDASLPEPVAKTSAALPQSTKTEIQNLIGVAFKPDIIREFHPAVIDELFNDLPYTCSICGLRLKLKERLERHLEWHALKNPEGSGSVMASRKWYPDLTSWVAGRTVPPLVPEAINSIDEPNEMMDIDEPIVPADENQCVCVICGDIFEDFYCQERDEWMFKGASYMSIPSAAGKMETTEESVLKGPIVHANCTVESSLSDSHVKLEPDA